MCKMNSIKNTFIAVAICNWALLTSASAAPAVPTILSGEDLPAINREVAKLVASMTLDEKMYLMYQDHHAIPRLGIPGFALSHGPYGARVTYTDADTGKRSIVPGTFMSCSINYAASWDPDLVEKVAKGVGREVRSKGDHMLAGPALNIIRDLRCGRSAEYYTEDPYLNARTTVAFTLGLQREYVIATLKHFACNNQ